MKHALQRHPRHRLRYAALLLVSMLLTLAVLSGWWGDRSESAHAAQKGTGETFGNLGYLGSFALSSGEHAYCVEIKVKEPWSPQAPVQTVSQLPAFGGDLLMGSPLGMGGVELHMPIMADPAVMRQMNYIMTQWGTTADARQGAAVALAMFIVRGDSIGYNSALHETLRERGEGAVVDRALQMVREAAANAVAPVIGVHVAEPTLTLTGPETAKLDYVPGVTELKLTNGVFADTGKAQRSLDGLSGGSLEVQLKRPQGWDSEYDVTVVAQWRSGADGWKAELRLHEPSVPGEQRVVTPTGKTTDMTRNGEHRVTLTVKHAWVPSIRTEVADRIVQVGSRFTDRVTLEADPRFDGWITDSSGGFMPIVAQGTLYGPLDRDPSADPQEEAPADAPIAATAELRVIAGPGTYEVTTDEVAIATGFYTWVWEVPWNEQEQAVIKPTRTGVSALSREAFPVRDQFGLAAETHLVQQRLTLTTRLTAGEVGLGWSVTDDVAVTAEQFGGWLLDGAGTQIPVVLRGTLYRSDEKPVRAPEPPENAEVLATTKLTVHDDGIVESEPVALPLDARGFVTMRWCVVPADQSPEIVEQVRPWCDDYGVPAETAEIQTPTVTTKAQTAGNVGESIHDVALIEGLVPNESELDFTAYLLPEAGAPKYDRAWKETGEHWTKHEIDQMTSAERCLAQPVATLARRPVNEAGEVRSEDIVAKSAGTVHWVERLTALDQTSNQRALVHEGECGIANETTRVSEPEAPEQGLAMTGSSGAGVLAGSVVVMLLGLGLTVFARARTARSR